MELFDLSLWAAPAGLLVAILAAVWLRSGWPIVIAVAAVPLGGALGRLAWEWLAEKQVGIDFGSEFEGYDWVLGFASVGLLLGALLGSMFAAYRRGRRAPEP